MHTAIAVWSLVVNPGTKETVVPPSDIQIHVKGLSLGAELKDKDGRSSLKLSYEFVASPKDDDDEDEEKDDEEVPVVTREVILGSLTPGKIEQAPVDIILDDEDEYVFEVVGKNPIHIVGNYIRDSSLSWGDDEDESDEEEAFHLGEVSSDVEIDPAELAGIDSDDVAMEEEIARFEEIVEEPKGKKRAAEKIDDGEKPPQLTKAEKKAAKKQKGENGVAIPKEGSVKETKEEKKEGKKEKKKEKEEKKKDGKVTGEVKELEGGVQIKDVKVGSGPGAQKGQSIKMRYIGKLTTGKVFDSNLKGKPFVFRLGAGEVIKGWDVGVVGMKAGGERELTIPPPFAYGKRKMGDIPPNSTLKFEVKLLSIS